MKFENRTNWNTAELREFFRLCCLHEGVEPFSVVAKKRKLRKGWRFSIHGRYLYFSKRIEMFIPDKYWEYVLADNGSVGYKEVFPARLGNAMVRDIAQVFLHELAHCRGIRKHKDMLRVSKLDVDFVNGITISKM